ncbi:hypothetical protein BCF11_0052 [Collimonas sp. PA-H2]|nr:hypothetical protein [Collimonas sp. PA-H2]PFH07715.1 hypothetical protein BCF11_0052 [Collimonas sp. PA-H2]
MYRTQRHPSLSRSTLAATAAARICSLSLFLLKLAIGCLASR